ncbi:MAG: leucine-rich repeat domain-containing protein [Mycoplasmoidaceae bacterium]|nr:leucine-rich repeat domain-containing protein [Mycoplasmoidaceae bacterium]
MEHSFKLNFAIHAKYTSDQHEYTSDYEGFQVTKKLALPINAFKIEINQSNKKILQGMSDDYIKNQDKYAQYDSIVIPNDIDEIEFGAFAESSLDSNIKYISFQKDSKISVIPYNFIHGNDSITDIDFKNVTELKSIQDNAFNNASALKNVDFSNCKNLIEIHDNAFAHSSIESIDLSNCSQIQKFYSFAFYQCLNLVELVLPSQVTEIDTYAFSDCIGLRLII